MSLSLLVRAARLGSRGRRIDQGDDVVHSVLETPAAIAGDIFTALLIRTKLYQTV
jgi:hypothetical protein